ncbi:hypothetical protein ABT160_26175 [Streptomyces sp. NPDC001941]|uniref:hypothetical protein n=1 Tax=Streptomyces sp. NPDC001941 TaxID=3154659 RepID=UPI00332D06A4
MAAPTPPSPRNAFETWVVKHLTWADPADYQRTKEAAYGWTSSFTAMKTDMTLLKAELSGLAAFSIGASLIKIDYTWFKMDEKGITINGRQRHGWPWADPAKAANLKAESSVRKLMDQQEKINSAVARLQRAAAGSTSANAVTERRGEELAAARSRMRASLTADSLREFQEAEKAYKKAQKLSEKAEKELREAKKEAQKIEKEASKRFTNAKQFMADEKTLKDKWKTEGNRVADESLNKLREAVGETAHALIG